MIRFEYFFGYVRIVFFVLFAFIRINYFIMPHWHVFEYLLYVLH